MHGSVGRRGFLRAGGAAAAVAAAAGLLINVPGHVAAAETADAPEASGSAIDFTRSFLHCAPHKSGIWVRIQMECFCTLIDRASGKSDEFALGVVAKTGATKDPKTSGLTPGYDYWLIFSRDKVYTRRTHASSYGRNPTTLTEAEFGPFGWHLERVPATPLKTIDEMRSTLKGWKRVVARTEFASADGARTCRIDYPVKWMDVGIEKSQYRVETGPIVLLDPERIKVGTPPAIEDFQWAYLDFHGPDSVRCLLDRPTPLLSEATFFPPKEDKRESRPNPALTAEQAQAIEKRLFADWQTPIPVDAMRELFSTDHYSDAVERKATNSLRVIA
jgi:hypothetical protein